jgi:hypothetical protein
MNNKMTIDPPTNLADVLTRAADRVELGWCQGMLTTQPTTDKDFDPDNCPVCAQGAVRWVLYGSPVAGIRLIDTLDGPPPLFRPSLNLLDAAILQSLPQKERELYVEVYGIHQFWNDDPRRTQQEVVDAFRTAAKLATSL